MAATVFSLAALLIPSAATACSDALARLCQGARRASPGDCLVCAGTHQAPLTAAGCSNPTIEDWCSGVGPPPSAGPVDTSTLNKKFMLGYQGWFATPCDGMGKGWSHWTRGNKTPGPDPDRQGFLNFDSWPDMSEFDADELCPTDLRYANGSVAALYSNANPKTVLRHFKWMESARIDGVWKQRFLSDVSRGGAGRAFNDKVSRNVAAGAEATGRTWAFMYDISGADPSTLLDKLRKDWEHVTSDLKLTAGERYLHHRGHPILAIWGLGFKDPKRNITAATATAVQDYFASVNVTLMGGVPTGWRDLTRDSETDPAWHAVYRRFAVISPWTVGRYTSVGGFSTVDKFLQQYHLRPSSGT